MVKPGEKVIVKYTYADFLQLPDDGKRYEIIHGDLYMTPAPGGAHQGLSMRLGSLLFAHIEKRKLGEIYAAPFDVVLDKRTVVEPDLVFISTAHLARCDGAKLNGAPDLAVEILSPSTAKRDRTVKLEAYAHFGVEHYWIVDPKRHVLEEYRLSGDAYELVSQLEGDATFKPAVFAGLKVPLAKIWAR